MKKFSKGLERRSLSIRHSQAQNSRKVINASEMLRSIMSIDHMQRMNLIAINNRCISKYSKIKRAEEMSNRYHKKNPFLPNIKKLKLDIRQSSPKHKLSPKTVLKKKPFPEEDEKIFQELIEDYLTKAETEKMLQEIGSPEHQQFIQDACKQIFRKIQERRNRLGMSIKRRKTQGTERSTYFNRGRHSFSSFKFEENLEQINKSKNYGQKARKLNQRMFLRKLQHLHDNSKKNQ